MTEEIFTSLPVLTVQFGGLILHLVLFNGIHPRSLEMFQKFENVPRATLAAADLLVCLIFCILPFILYFMPYSWYDLTMKLPVQLTMCASSVIEILSTSADRYVMVAYPIR